MKRIVTILLCMALLVALSACQRTDTVSEQTPVTTTTQLLNTTPSTEETENITSPTETLDTTPATAPTEANDNLPYIQKIKRPDQPIYDGPSYDNYQVGTIEKSGSFTIVQEYIDEEGNLWGKLKSGAGWVDLTQILKENNTPPLITAAPPSKALLQSGKYHHFVDDTSEYMVQTAIRIRETVTNVAIYDVVMAYDNEYLQELFTLDTWQADMPIVADVTFPGPGALYEIHFTDANGKRHRYTLAESGRNGDVDISEWSILD